MIPVLALWLGLSQGDRPPPAFVTEHHLYYFAEGAESPDDGRYAHVLARFARRATEDGAAAITIDLHEDRAGSDAQNLDLTRRRGAAAQARLVALGLRPETIEVRAHGESRPPVPTPDGVAEPLNRLMHLDYRTR